MLNEQIAGSTFEKLKKIAQDVHNEIEFLEFKIKSVDNDYNLY